VRAQWKARGLCLCRVFAVISVALFYTPTPSKGGDPEGDHARQLRANARRRSCFLAFLVAWRRPQPGPFILIVAVRSRVNKQGSEAVGTRKTTRKIPVCSRFLPFKLISAGAPISLQATGRQNVNRGPARTRIPSVNALSEFSRVTNSTSERSVYPAEVVYPPKADCFAAPRNLVTPCQKRPAI
jgi:hypothetical protein